MPMYNVFARNRVFLVKLVNTAAVVLLVCGFSLWATIRRTFGFRNLLLNSGIGCSSLAGPYATDGVFSGSAQGYGGPVNMQVTIENGYIEDVQVISAPNEDAPYLSQAVKLLDVIKDEQTVNVDTVSGCTYSSVGILNGTKEALEKSNAGKRVMLHDVARNEGFCFH